MVRYLDQVKQGIEYIEANLDFDVPLHKVAEHAGLSLWHFQRIFKALTKETLKTYIRTRRLAGAMEKLLYSREKIIDIAMTAGYESQESFTRAFKKVFLMTPDEYRRMGSETPYLKKVQFDEDYLRHLHAGISIEPQIQLQPKRNMIGLKTNIYGPDSEKNNMAEKLPPLWQEFAQRMNEVENKIPGVAYGAIFQSGTNTDKLTYYAAVQTDLVKKQPCIPEAMESCVIEAAMYAIFEHRGLVKNLDHTVNYIYSNWLLQSDYRHTGGPDLEIYGSGYIPDSEDSVIFYAIPINQ